MGRRKSSKLLKAWGPSRTVITLLNLFWYILEMYIARYGMYRLYLKWLSLRYDLNDRPRPKYKGVLVGRGDKSELTTAKVHGRAWWPWS
ncbi:hypothetical protein EPI10_031491 [Gossypium australe]|uniref:Uncharacterized protein n=1 Tax=Gossypium australe TaxID=47621 RepID=A0A5B6X465_9ROSI|nr:hypothetical protein EPI10_031491 [Gossypium australe]